MGSRATALQTLRVRTRPEPRPAAGGRVLHVYPPGYKGPTEQPAFFGLLQAYYQGALGGDWSRASPPRVRAGDVIKVHAGVYLSRHDHYSHEINSGFTTCCGTPWDGTYYLTQKGTADKPIAIVAAGDGEAIFDGDGNAVLFNLMGSQYHYFEGLTLPQHGYGFRGRHQGHRGQQRAHGEALEVQRHRHRRAFGLVRLAQFLHRRQRHARARDRSTMCSPGMASRHG